MLAVADMLIAGIQYVDCNARMVYEVLILAYCEGGA